MESLFLPQTQNLSLMAALSLLSSPSFLSLHTPRLLPSKPLSILLKCSISEFNISFSPPKPQPIPKTLTPTHTQNPSLNPQPLLIPWIVLDESGNLKLQSTPPARFFHAMAEEELEMKKEGKTNEEDKKKKKKRKTEKDVKVKAGLGSCSGWSLPPAYSKAARRFYNEWIREPPQRLSKVLAAAGVASRRSSEELIFGGKVTVNGSVCTSPQTRVDLLKDSIYVNGNCISKKLPPKLYFALNKPKGYICSSGEESKTVLSLFDGLWKSWNKTNPGVPKPRLFTVGRLDVATSGLIIVTNDGEFAHSLAHPSSELSKEYIATIAGSVHRKHLIAISEGTQLDGVHCVPDSVELLPTQPEAPRARLRIVVHEGRNHEVRELVKNAGLQLHSLKRVRIGGFRLPSDLGIGKYVELKQADLKSLGSAVLKSMRGRYVI